MIAFLIKLALGGWGFLKAIPPKVWLVIGAVLALLFAWHVHSNAIAAGHDRDFKAGYDAAIAAATEAQRQADTGARAAVKKTVAAQAVINKESSNALLQDIRDIDTRANGIRVRHDEALARRAAAARDQSATGGPAASTCPAPAEDGLAWSVAYPLMVQAAKNEAQLNAILDWEDQQQALDALEPVE